MKIFEILVLELMMEYLFVLILISIMYNVIISKIVPTMNAVLFFSIDCIFLYEYTLIIKVQSFSIAQLNEIMRRKAQKQFKNQYQAYF